MIIPSQKNGNGSAYDHVFVTQTLGLICSPGYVHTTAHRSKMAAAFLILCDAMSVLVYRPGLDQGLEEWCGVMSVCVVSLDSLFGWKVQVSVNCAWRTPAHLRCTQCSILLNFMYICFISCICLWQIL